MKPKAFHSTQQADLIWPSGPQALGVGGVGGTACPRALTRCSHERLGFFLIVWMWLGGHHKHNL